MNKWMYKSQIAKLEQQYNNYFNRHYVLNNYEIDDLITYPTVKMIKSYIANYISSQEIDEADFDDYFLDFDWNNFIDDFLNYMFYGYCAFEIVYAPSETGIAVSDVNLIPYRFISRTNDTLTDTYLRLNEDITLPYEKFLWRVFASPKPFGTSILTKDVAKLICEGREQFINQSYYMYRLANPTVWQKIENAANESKVLNILSKIRTGLAGITIGENDEIGVLSEGSTQGALFNDNIYNIDKKISNLMYFPYQLIDRNGTGSYNQSENETKIFNKNVNAIITDLNDLIADLCDKIAIVNELSGDLEPAKIPLISEDNEQLVLDYLKEFVNPADNEEFYQEFTEEWLSRNLSYEYEGDLVFKKEESVPNGFGNPDTETDTGEVDRQDKEEVAK